MSIFREFNINMIPGKPPLIIHVSQYESDFVYTFNLISGKGVLAIPDTAIAVIRGTKRDGNGYSKEASLDTENNKVVVIGEVQMTACAGRNVFELAIINDEKVICTANFFLDVERAPLDSDTIQSETVLHDLQAIINSAATATQAAEEASASAESAASAAEQAVEEKFEDGVAETIDEWLTNHPEATTTVQDGSLTASKFNASFRTNLYTTYKTLAEMIADTALISGVLVYIAESAEIFEITSTIPADNSYETLVNGLYAHRIVITTTPNAEKYVQNNDYAVSIMGDTALSYIKYSNIDNDTSTRFFYDTSGLYSNWGTLPTETRDGKHGITCSPFVMDLLYGVSYENSAYIDGANKLNPSMLRDSPLISYFYPPQIGSKYLATYAIKNGFAFFPEADLSNLRAGDVIFTTLEGSEDNIYGVGHCEVIGYWINNNKFLVWHAGSVPRTNVRTVSSFADQVVLCARFPFKNSHLELTNIVKYGEADVSHTVNNTWVVADYHLSENLDVNKYYTAIFKMTSVNDISVQYPAIRLPDGTVLSATYSGATEKPINDVYCIPFKAETSANTIRLGMTRANDTVSYDTVTVDWMVVVKGIITSPIDYISPPFELLINNASELVHNEKIVTFTPTSGSAYESFGNCFYYKIGTRVHIHVGISGLTAGTATMIYQMPAGYRPYAQVATAGQGDSITNKAVMAVGISGSIRIASETTYALIDIEYDAFQ